MQSNATPRITEMKIHADSVELFIAVCRSMGGDAKEVSRSGQMVTVSITYGSD